MRIKIPTPSSSSGATLRLLRQDLMNAGQAAFVALNKEPLFKICKSNPEVCAHEAPLTELTVLLIESMFGILKHGTKDSLEEYLDILKDRAKEITGINATNEQILVAQNILSSYSQSSLSLCQLYGWMYKYGYNDEAVQKVLTYTCELLVYAVASYSVCMDLAFIASIIVCHWKLSLEDTNYARLYVIVLAAKDIKALAAAGWGGSDWGYDSTLLDSCEADSWGYALYASHTNQYIDIEFKALWTSVQNYTWDDSVDLFKDAKSKRRICERAGNVRAELSQPLKEINRIATEQLHPTLTVILSVCRAAICSENILALQTSSATQKDIKNADTHTQVFQATGLLQQQITTTLKTATRVASTVIDTSYKEELRTAQEENEQLHKDCRAYLRRIEKLEEENAAVVKSNAKYTEKDMDELRKQIIALKSEVESMRSCVNSAAKQQSYIAQLKATKEQLSSRLAEVVEEQRDLQDRYDELIQQQQAFEEERESYQPHNPLVDEELLRLRQLRVYGIAPDTPAMRKLSECMPSSKIVLVGQNEGIHEDIQSNYDFYFFVTALAGHKVYSKWRSKVKSLKAPYCHCNSTGMNVVARQILREYEKQVICSGGTECK